MSLFFAVALDMITRPSKERSPPEATGQGTKSQRQAANSQRPRGLPAAAGTRVWTRVVSLLRERPSFAARRKKAKARPREPISRRFPWESLPDDQGGSAPIGSPTFGRETGVYGGRWTMSPPPSLRDQPAGWLWQSVPPAPRPHTIPPSCLSPLSRASRPGALFLFPPPKISPRRIVIFARLLYNSILG